MGVWTFGKRFRASFHTTPHHYIVDRRLARAQKLLAGALRHDKAS
jgi:AraC family transcriptional regulator